MGLPLEVLVKEHRRNLCPDKTFISVQECAENFAHYLENGVKFSPQNEEENVERIVLWTVRSIKQKVPR